MRDYRYQNGAGREVPVSEMLTMEIQDCLTIGFLNEDQEVPDAAIRERLRLELEIRALGLR